MRRGLWLTLAVLALAPPAQAAQRLNVSHFGSNDVASFLIGANGAPLGVAGSPFDVTPGTGPRGLASTADARFLYAGNSSNGVEGFSAAPSGVLTLLPGSTFMTGGQAGRVAITPNGRFLFAANNDGSSNSVSRFSVGASGALTSLGAATLAGPNPFVPAVARGGRFLYHSGNGNLNGFTIGSDGSLTQLPSLPLALASPRSLTASPDGSRIYVAQDTSSQVAGFAVGTDGSLTPLPSSPYTTGTAPEEVAISPDGRWLFAGRNDGATSSIDQFAIAANGSLSSTGGTIATGASVGGVDVTADSRFVYGADSTTMLHGRAIGPAGALSAIPGLPMSTGGVAASGGAVAVAPDQPPVARASARTGRGRAVAFDARATSDPDGTPVRYDWTFGDGTPLPNGGPTPTHVYARDGAFTAAVVVTDDLGCATTPSYNGRQAVCRRGPGRPSDRRGPRRRHRAADLDAEDRKAPQEQVEGRLPPLRGREPDRGVGAPQHGPQGGPEVSQADPQEPVQAPVRALHPDWLQAARGEGRREQLHHR